MSKYASLLVSLPSLRGFSNYLPTAAAVVRSNYTMSYHITSCHIVSYYIPFHGS